MLAVPTSAPADNIVWVFREPRSGSTALTDHITNHLNRTHLFVDLPLPVQKILNISNSTEYVFSTHSFELLELMEKYSGLVTLVRCSRKDKAEQCLSHLLVKWMNNKVESNDHFWNMYRDGTLSETISTFDNAEPTIFTKKQVMEYIDYLNSIDEYWNRLAKHYENITVFYEDMCSCGVSIPSLGIESFSIITEESSTIKIPQYKERLCLNHEMVKRWIQEG